MKCKQPVLPILACPVEAYVASWIEITQVGAAVLQAMVEAYVASWIEILFRGISPRWLASRLMLPRGLKYLYTLASIWSALVEAYVASWIEILYIRR